MWETWVQSLGWEIPWRREQLPTPVFWPGEFHRLYSPWGRKIRTWLSDFHFIIKCKVTGLGNFQKHSLLGPQFHGASDFFFFFFFCWLFPLPGIKPVSSALEAQNLNQWTTREVLSQWNFNWYFSYLRKYHLGTIFHTYILSIRESGWLFFQNKSQVCPCFSTFSVKNPVQASII